MGAEPKGLSPGKNPEIDKAVKTDEGDYFCFPFIRGEGRCSPPPGLIIRKDWLNELGLALPQTIDEWYIVLKAFKEKKGATAPLTMQKGDLRNDFANAFNFFAPTVGNGFYVDRGKVKYGWTEPGFKGFYATMNKWFKEGLLDPNFSTVSSSTIDANIASGKSGAAHGSGGSGIGRWLPVLQKANPKADLAGTVWPAAKKGEKVGQVRQLPGDLAGRGRQCRDLDQVQEHRGGGASARLQLRPRGQRAHELRHRGHQLHDGQRQSDLYRNHHEVAGHDPGNVQVYEGSYQWTVRPGSADISSNTTTCPSSNRRKRIG